MLWGKYWELIDDQRTGLWQSHRADGLRLCVVVALELGSQCKLGRFFFLLSLQPRLAMIADRSWTELRHFVWSDHEQILQMSHRSPRIALVRMMRIIVRMADMVLLARATKSFVSGLVGSHLCWSLISASCCG